MVYTSALAAYQRLDLNKTQLMQFVIKYNETNTTFDLDELAKMYSGIVNIGRKCKEVWNTVAIEDESVDPFQCNIVGAVGGDWRLKHGQNRTECPKGLLSNKTIPCSSCMGRCVGTHPGKARYYQRKPEIQTLLNGKPLSEWGNVLKTGDTISFGNVTITVEE